MKRVMVRRALGGAAICLAGGATLALAGAALAGAPPSSAVPAAAVSGAAVPAVASVRAAARPAGSLLDRFGIASGNIMTIAGAPALPASQPPRDLALYGLSGIAVDANDGMVYVTDAVRHMIFRLDAKGTKVEPFAGTRSAGFNGDGQPALQTQLNVPADLVVDPRTGDVYFADSHNYRVRAVSKDGSKVWTVAGRGIRGVLPAKIPVEWPLIGPKGRRDTVVFSGDGGAAGQAELNQPTGVAVDAAGNVYIADTSNHRVRAVNRQSKTLAIAGVQIPPGAIATIAGTGERGFTGDGGPATAAKMDSPRKVRVTADGDVLFIDMLNQRIRKIDHQTGRIDTVAKGTTFPGQLPGGAEVVFFSIDGLDVGPRGEVIYSDLQANSVFQLDLAKGAAKVIVGAGLPGRSANGEEAATARLHGAGAVALAPGGEVYIVDVWNALLWQFKDGRINIFAGGGKTGNGGPSQDAEFGPLAPIDVDPQGNVYVSDMYAHTIRRIRADNGTIERFAGSGAVGYSGDGGPPQDAKLLTIINLSVIDDDIYLADSQIPNLRRVVRRPDGDHIETFAGVPFQWQYKSGDGGPAKLAQFGLPQSVVRHPKTGEYYVSDSWLNNIRRIDHEGFIHPFAGVPGQQSYGGDGGPATQAKFGWPVAMVFDDDGNLYIVDHFNSRIRKIDGQGIITTFAGTGERGPDGEGVPANQAKLNYPLDIARGKDHALYIADMGNNCVRRIDLNPPHLITTAVGICGERGFSGDGGPARIAHLNVPRGIAIGPDNALYIADSFNGRIRAVRLPAPTARADAGDTDKSAALPRATSAIYRMPIAGTITVKVGDLEDPIAVSGATEMVEQNHDSSKAQVLMLALHGTSQLLHGKVTFTESSRPGRASSGNLGTNSVFELYLDIETPDGALAVEQPVRLKGSTAAPVKTGEQRLDDGSAIAIFHAAFNAAADGGQTIADASGRQIGVVTRVNITAERIAAHRPCCPLPGAKVASKKTAVQPAAGAAPAAAVQEAH